MALGELTKQIAQQALLSATEKAAPPPSQTDNLSATVLGQVHAMQKALKEDEELVVLFHSGAERIRIMEIFVPTRQLAVLSGLDGDRNLTRVISPIEALQLVCKVIKVQSGAKPTRVNLVTPKSLRFPAGDDACGALVPEHAHRTRSRANRRPAAGSRPSQTAARIRRIWPWANRATSPSTVSACAIAALARAATCSMVSPFGTQRSTRTNREFSFWISGVVRLHSRHSPIRGGCLRYARRRRSRPGGKFRGRAPSGLVNTRANGRPPR